jgi:hypothetical protein
MFIMMMTVTIIMVMTTMVRIAIIMLAMMVIMQQPMSLHRCTRYCTQHVTNSCLIH